MTSFVSQVSERGKEVVRQGISLARRPMTTRELQQELRDVRRPYKIEVGAYRGNRPGWICTDVHWRSDAYLNVAKPWPVPSASVSHIYADNVIEHLQMIPNRAFFREALRVLVPGGKIRLSTPDIGRLSGLYLENSDEVQMHLNEMKADGMDVHYPVDLLRVTFHEHGHANGYLWDFSSLELEL